MIAVAGSAHGVFSWSLQILPGFYVYHVAIHDLLLGPVPDPREATSSSILTTSSFRCIRSDMAFVLSPLPIRPCHTRPLCSRRVIYAQAEPGPNTPPIPPSLAAACETARTAITAAKNADCKRIFVEIDTTNGDATYTLLNTSIPIARMLYQALEAPVILPDTGSAALARRDWDATIFGFEETDALEAPEDLFIVAPRASETDRLVRLVKKAHGSVVILNPDLVDMGVTGLSLNARRLRESLLDTFEPAYYLRTFSWGVLQREWGGAWGVWVDDPEQPSGFRLLACEGVKPVGDRLDEILAEGEVGNGGVVGMIEGVKKFLSVYMKG